MNIKETDVPCCSDPRLVPALYVPVPVQSSAIGLGPAQPGLGLAQMFCTKCMTRWGVATTGAQVRIARAKTAIEMIES